MAGMEEMADVRGGDGEVSPEQLAEFKTAAEALRGASSRVARDQWQAAAARRAFWHGQNLTGDKRETDLGEDPAPFEKCSDQRVRWGDQIVQDQLRLFCAALLRAEIRAIPRGPGDEQKANRMTLFLRYLVSALGSEWWRQWLALMNYVLADAPACGIMRVGWERRETLDMETLTVQDLAQMYLRQVRQAATVQGAALTPKEEGQTTALFLEALTDREAGEDALAAMVGEWFPKLRPARCRRIVRQVRESGTADFPVPRTEYEGIRLAALRVGTDALLIEGMRDFQRTPYWFEPRWMSKAEIERCVTMEGWSRAFADDVLAHEKEAAFEEYAGADRRGEMRTVAKEVHAGEYQVVVTWWVGVSEDGVPARYQTIWHKDSMRTAFGRRLLRDRHGRWGAHFFPREVLSDEALDTRSVAEMLAPAQAGAKRLLDVGIDNAEISGLPPVTSYGLGRKGEIVMGALKHIDAPRYAEVKFMAGPQFPAAAVRLFEIMREERDAYWGRPGGAVDPGQVRLAIEANVLWWKAQVLDVLRMMLADGMQYATDEMLARIVDAQGNPALRSRAELAGQWDVELSIDTDALTLDVLEKKVALLAQVKQLDSGQTLDAAPLAGHVVRGLFPEIADEAVRSREASAQDEIRSEIENLKTIRANVLPPVDEEGRWDYAARLAWHEQQWQQAPQMFADMSPYTVQVYQQYIEMLRHQNQQYGENVETGRAGAKAEGMAAAPA
jgi:hypothetical protein